MFRPSFRSSSPFPLPDLDMWDTNSRFTSQTSAWCGMASVSGTGFLSKVSTSTSGSTGGFRQNDPGLRKWQSVSHLAPEGVTRPFPPSPGAELRAARGESNFRQAEATQWLHDAHERLDTQLDRLRSRNSQLSYNINTAQLLDMKHKQLSGTLAILEQEKEAAGLSQFEKSRQTRELHEKVLQLEKDLMQMRSTLETGNNDQPAERTPSSLSRALRVSQEDFNKQERQKADTELCKLRETLRDAEARAKTQEEERKQALQKLHTSTEAQQILLTQMEEMNKKLSHTRQNHSDVQEELSEANNKISQACLEKAMLSTQVLKMEDNIKDLRGKLAGALSDKAQITQEADHQRAQGLEEQLQRPQQSTEGSESQNNKQDHESALIKGELKALREVNEKLTRELKILEEKLKISQSQLQEVTAERASDSKQITDLQAEQSRLIWDKEELLSKMNEGGHELTKMKDKCCQLRESVELEKQKLQDRFLCLEAEVLEKEERLHLQEEEHRKQDAVRLQSIEGLKGVASHWAEKWEKVALTLKSTQEELQQLKKNNSRDELKAEAVHLATELEKLQRERQKDKQEIKNLLQHKIDIETVLTRAKKESDSLLRVELDACKQELELERSRSRALLHRYKEKGGEASVQTEDTETQTDLSESSLLWEPPSDCHSSQNKAPQVKDKKAAVEDRKDKTVCTGNSETDQQRRMVTEQLKNLFKEREGNDLRKADSRSAAGQTGVSSLQDGSQTAKAVRSSLDRRSWQHGSGLMPVLEEDEEGSDWPGGEEGRPAEEAHAKEEVVKKYTKWDECQMSSMCAEISDLKAKNEKLLQAKLRCKHPIQDCLPTTAEKLSDKPSHCLDEIDLQQRSAPSLYPDGIFQAELVIICSPNEEEKEDD